MHDTVANGTTAFLFDLGLALALGMLIGLERGWHEREAGEGTRIAGIRTFALIAVVGGLSVFLGDAVTPLLLPIAFAALAALLIVAYFLQSQRERDVGVTTIVAALVTFLLGAMAAYGRHEIALAVAVVTSLLLGLKPQLHALVGRLSENELLAVFKLLLISVVALPLIPNQGYGPWNALNPYEIWWMVVLIAALSSVGYFAMRLVGPGRGLLVTGALGGLASSTALTLSFARINRRETAITAPLAGGILLACAMMFPRVWVEVLLVQPSLAPKLIAPLATMAVVAAAVLLWQRPTVEGSQPRPRELVSNPFELRSALIFGGLLAAVMLLTQAGRSWLGDQGVYLVATLAALSDVDAITLALARGAGSHIDAELAARAIVLSAAVNTVVKGIMAGLIGGRALWRLVALPLIAGALAGLGVALLL